MKVQIRHFRNKQLYFPFEFWSEEEFKDFFETLHACENAIREEYGRKRYKMLVANLEKRVKKAEYIEGNGVSTFLFQNEMSDFVTCIVPIFFSAECFETIVKKGDDELIKKIKKLL